jgi:hypothetical protein
MPPPSTGAGGAFNVGSGGNQGNTGYTMPTMSSDAGAHRPSHPSEYQGNRSGGQGGAPNILPQVIEGTPGHELPLTMMEGSAVADEILMAMVPVGRIARVGGRAFFWTLEKAGLKLGSKAAAETANMYVYRSVRPDGTVQYVGITNNFGRRMAEHARGPVGQIVEIMSGLTKKDAHAVEQALIEIHGLGKNGGTLMNRINSIAPSRADYAQQVERGLEVLREQGYNF